MFTFFQSDKFLFFCLKYQKLIFYFFVSLLVLGLWEGLIVSPQDYVQGNSVRIMYVHVPSAWISLGIFSVIGILSIFSFIYKIKNFLIIEIENSSIIVQNHLSQLCDQLEERIQWQKD